MSDRLPLRCLLALSVAGLLPSVTAGGKATCEFRVTAGRGTYSAHYPIHAWATFDVGGNLHRQRVDWSDGGQVWVNRGPDDWRVAGQILPQYGFYARIPTDGGTVTASVSRRQGLIVEQARSPREIYCNGRGGIGRSSAAATVDEAEFRARHNETNKRVDFGPAVTAGGCRLTRDGDDGLLITPLPLPTKGSTIEIRWEQLPWRLPRPTHVEALGHSGQVVGRKPIGETLRLECDANVFAYRLLK